jgi:hypothetical protein
MITNVVVTSTPVAAMPGYFQITVKATVTRPFNNAGLKPGYPKASLVGGTVFPPSTQAMSTDPAVANGFVAVFTGSSGNYTATVTENWTYMAETGDANASSGATPVP